jgi:hypothetical protein
VPQETPEELHLREPVGIAAPLALEQAMGLHLAEAHALALELAGDEGMAFR